MPSATRRLLFACLTLFMTAFIVGSAYGLDRSTFDSLMTQAYAFENANHLDSAIVVALQALEIAERDFGHVDTSTAGVLNCLGRYNYYSGQTKKASQYWTEALRLRDSLLGPDHIETAKSKINASLSRMDEGHYQEAADLISQSLPAMKREYGADHLNVGRTLLNLGNASFLLGRLATAEEVYLQSLDIAMAKAGPESWEAGAALNGLASAIRARGKFERAEEFYRRAADIYRKLFGDQNLYVGRLLHNVGKVCRDQGKWDEARDYYEQALAIYRAQSGPMHPDIGVTLNNLGRMYLVSGDIDKAEDYTRQAGAAYATQFDADHPLVAMNLTNQGEIDMVRAQYEAADSLFTKAEAIERDKLAPDHPELAGTLELHAKLYRLRGQNGKAVEFAEQACRSRWRSLRDNGPLLSERDALTYAGYLRASLSLYLSACRDAGLFGESFPSEAADLILSSKGQVTEAMASRQRELVYGASDEVKAILDSLQAVKFQLSRAFVEASETTQSPGPTAADSLGRLAQRIESDLSRRSTHYRDLMESRQVTADEIVATMPAHSALIEFVRYDYGDLRADTMIGRYAVVVMRPNETPAVLDLGPAGAIDASIDSYRRHMIRASALGGHIPSYLQQEYAALSGRLYGDLWKPILDYVRDAKLIFIAPDGGINLVSFAGLPDENGMYIVERHPLQYVSSARDLLRSESERPTGEGLLALGDPSFTATTVDAPAPPPTRRVNAANRTALRSGCLNLGDMALSPLPETRKEVTSVADQWRRLSEEPATVLLGAEATESSVKVRAPGTRVIHLATHGYFLEGSCFEQAGPVKSEAMLGFAGENPLLLSGLFLAGAALGADSVDAGEDGVLTAYEISALDLRGTDLVVLSACESGLGRIEAGEGVYGLRRAFQMAGVRTVISALWPVTDESAAAILSGLYRDDNMRVAETMRALQLRRLAELRDSGRSDHPVDWAAYVAIGDER